MILYSDIVSESIIFTHIPKTGGTSIEKAFGQTISDAKGKHADIQMIKDHLLKIGKENHYKEAFKFTIVRNPFDQLYSFWNYHTNIFRDNSVFIFENDFNEFLKNLNLKDKSVALNQVYKDDEKVVAQAQIVWKQLFQKQYAYIEKNMELDFIGRFERLHQDFELVKKITKFKTDLPHLNKASNKKPYWMRYDKKGREIAEELLEEDLKTFNYRF